VARHLFSSTRFMRDESWLRGFVNADGALAMLENKFASPPTPDPTIRGLQIKRLTGG
jgi:hypothetical protein